MSEFTLCGASDSEVGVCEFEDGASSDVMSDLHLIQVGLNLIIINSTNILNQATPLNFLCLEIILGPLDGTFWAPEGSQHPLWESLHQK